mmetsp:Transcript_91940/g.265227  ORF Transcript_91940/g.265227 Transcript_91940/m.265227 type:complete len:251 (-) Transcript_91940:267-1019(-)
MKALAARMAWSTSFFAFSQASSTPRASSAGISSKPLRYGPSAHSAVFKAASTVSAWVSASLMCISTLTRARSLSVLVKISWKRSCNFFATPSSSVSLPFISGGTSDALFVRLSVISFKAFCVSSVLVHTSLASSSLNLPASVSNSIFSMPRWTVVSFSSLPSQASRDFSSLSAEAMVFLALAISCCAPLRRPCNCESAPARPPLCFFSRAFSAMAFFASLIAAAAAFSASAQLLPAPRRSARGVSMLASM